VAAAGVLGALVLAVAVGPPVAERLLGHGPNDIFPYAVDELLKPVGPWTRIPATFEYSDTGPRADAPTTLLVLGADGPLGRDMLLRLLEGGRVSLSVAVGGTVLALLIGTLLGALAGYFGGWIDAAVARVTELVMAFPLLFFVILLAGTIAHRLDDLTFGGVLVGGAFPLIVIIGLFTWFYPARIVRAQVLALRQREFVEAARMTGASDWRIFRRHLLPHLGPTLSVYAMLLLATNVLLEAGFSFLGVGIQLPNASWGSLLATNWGTARSPNVLPADQSTIWLTLLPSLAILAAVLSINLVGEALRSAADPESVR
jgi:peptide/nickel transport system permease protein